MDKESYLCHTQALVYTFHSFDAAAKKLTVLRLARTRKVRASEVNELLGRCLAEQVVEEVYVVSIGCLQNEGDLLIASNTELLKSILPSR